MEIIVLVLLIAIVVIQIFAITRNKPTSESDGSPQLVTLQVQNDEKDKRIVELQAQIQEDLNRETQLQEKITDQVSEISSLKTERKSLTEQVTNNADDIKKSKEELAQQFKILSADILKEQSNQFSNQNKQSVEELLKPMREHLDKFKKETEEFYVKTGKDNHSLSERLTELMQMNNRLSEDANNLTNALKRDTKAQGNWGEVILERILESTGLQKGIHFTPQETNKNEEGKTVYPDMVVHLPEERHLVIDSKVSLTAYERFTSTDDEIVQKEALKSHLISIKKHIDELSKKDYQKLHGTSSPDFVVMFIPIEPAFIQAVATDESLWQYAWKNNVLLVSPSSLLFVTRIVMQLWRQEDQKENIEKIVERGAKLYDKLQTFASTFEKIGSSIDSAKSSYDDAFNQLSTGRGNAIRQAEMLKDLGVVSKKEMPHKMRELSLDEPAEIGEVKKV